MPSSYFSIEIRVEIKTREILSCQNPEIKYPDYKRYSESRDVRTRWHLTLGNRTRNLPHRKPCTETNVENPSHSVLRHKRFLNNEFTVLLLQSRERWHLCRQLDPLLSLSNSHATVKKLNYPEEIHSVRIQLNLARKGLDSSLTSWKVGTRLTRLWIGITIE